MTQTANTVKKKEYTVSIIDPGYGNFKLARLNPDTGDFLITVQPSIISRVPDWEYEKLNGVGKSACIEWKGERYLVGNIAMTYGLAIPSLTKDWMVNLACPLFALSFCSDTKKIYVMLSPSDWELKPEIEKSLKEAGFETINFMAQGTGIWLDAGAPKNAIVIDIGFNTVDVLMVLNGSPVRELCFALKECGLVSFLEKLTKDDPVHLARRLEEGDEILADKIKNYYFKWLFEKLNARTEWRKKPLGVKLVFGGGGALFLPDDLRKASTVPKDPVIANVRGLTRYLINNKRT